MKKIITDIEPQKKNKERFNVFVNDVFYKGMSEYVILKYKLTIGSELQEDVIEQAIFEDDLEKAKAYIANYHTNKTEKIIRDKLKEKGYDEKITEAVLAFLHHYHYIDDAQYAKRLTSDSIRLKKQGKNKIRQTLYEKGVDKETIEATLNEVNEEDEIDAMKKLLEKKGPHYRRKAKNIYEWKQKLFAFLLTRGFTGDRVKEAVEHYIHTWDNE